MNVSSFPEGFLWGVATAAYQIEGATDEDGRGESIWDRFSHTPGRTAHGDTGDVACDHYHRWESDLDLLVELGVDAYRFSIAWPRILPTADIDQVNEAGLTFYEQLVDGLLDRGIKPFATLYHWDLPQVLEDKGGWANRETAYAFADYAYTIAERLGDRVSGWMTINEPWVVSVLGYERGEFAPGRTSLTDSLAASHHLLLGHGLAMHALRDLDVNSEAGIVLNFTAQEAKSDHPEDRDKQRFEDGTNNRWFIEPIVGKGYPEDILADLRWDQSPVLPGDLEIISTPIDFLGVNYYTRVIVGDSPAAPTLVSDPNLTEMGWEIYPSGIYEFLTRFHHEHHIKKFYITENGAAMRDVPDDEGFVDDQDRIEFLRRHFAEGLRAIDDGAPLAGWFVWSMMDNFEWASGYGKRFGVIRVDYETQQRTVKSSGRWLADVIEANGLSTST
ncbi:MAG: beta-glucosidase [Acidimicrobiia bacterium]|nr:beta-glucosidase [Acidimicrobiia bacterium]NNL27529.1 beta-glucosidase [Acidimicrobiia bacterium]